ncbi:MAG: hypothetical protein E6G10_17200 [Actinobacteria bacterium]|nr:MAG: hypothetical protein E6G10_17200 [Actinomycetota bacterium]
MASDVIVAGAARRTVGEAGAAYIDHLEHVMERKRTTIADYRGDLRKHLAPFFGGRPLDKLDRARVESYLLAKKREGLSAKTIQNHLNFLNGLFVFAIKREWATANPVALVDRPKAPRSAHRRMRFLSMGIAARRRALRPMSLKSRERREHPPGEYASTMHRRCHCVSLRRGGSHGGAGPPARRSHDGVLRRGSGLGLPAPRRRNDDGRPDRRLPGARRRRSHARAARLGRTS